MELSLATIVLWAVPVVFAITLHEAAHGFVARQFGDQTAYMLGRVTLNPLKHIDPIGTILVPGFLLSMSAPFIFGWAKPVPVNFGNLRQPKRDMLWVAGAGPFANFVMAVAWAFLLKAAAPGGMIDSDGMFEMAKAGVQVNTDADGAQSVADSAPGRRPHCGEPPAGPDRLPIRPHRAVWLHDPDRAAGTRTRSIICCCRSCAAPDT